MSAEYIDGKSASKQNSYLIIYASIRGIASMTD